MCRTHLFLRKTIEIVVVVVVVVVVVTTPAMSLVLITVEN